MITERMQIQLLADRLAGLPVKVKAGELNEPWATCWRGLEASKGTTNPAAFVALDLAWGLIHNKCFPDQKPIPRPGCNVLYVDAEMVPQILNERATNYQIDRGKLYIMMPKAGEMIDFAVDQYKDQMIEMGASLQPELAIVDSLSSIHSRGQEDR